MAAPVQGMDSRIEKWQKNLLDLSLRNRLLNFKPDKAVQLIRPAPSDILAKLVDDEQLLSVRELASPSDNPEKLKLGEREVLAETKGKGTSTELRKMRLKAKGAISEQGVNILYIGFGLLRWYETDKSAEELYSPLVMVPVELVKGGPLDPFKIRIIEEDTVVNPTLALRLYTDFKLVLPEWPEDGAKLLTYLKDVAGTIIPMKRWVVEETAFLGLFSFAKLSMYRELEANADIISSHPLLNALAGNPALLPPVPDYPSGGRLDTDVDLSETFQVLDADSSQQEAVEMSKRGISFVLQGPPGTGKSQTIANIIAENLALGRKVLFVSEKMAALEVVKKRLDEKGLGDYTLEMHSHKANKNAVIDELRRCLQPVQPSPTIADDMARLNRAKNALNSYVRRLHEMRQPLGRSVFSGYGRLASLASMPELPVSIPKAIEMRLEDLDEELKTVRRIETAKDLISRSRSSPWNDLKAVGWKAGDEALVEAALRELAISLTQVKEQSLALSDTTGADRSRNMGETKRLTEMLERAATTPYPPETWLAKGQPEILTNRADEMLAFYQNAAADNVWIVRSYGQDMSSFDTSEMLRRFEQNYRGSLRILSGAFKSDLAAMQKMVKDGRQLRYQDALEDLRRIENWKEGQKRRTSLEQGWSDDFGLRFKGEMTDFNELRTCLQWSSSFVHDYLDLLNDKTRAIVCQAQRGARNLQGPIKDARGAMERFQLALDAIKKWFVTAEILSDPAATSYDRCEDFVNSHLSSMPLLKERVEMVSLEQVCVDRELSELFDLARKGALPANNLASSYEKRFYRIWLDQIVQKDDRLKNFHSDEHAETVRLFQALDKEMLTSAPKRLRARLDAFRSLSITSTEAKGTELYSLKRELTKKKNVKQIRQLFNDHPHIIMELKPCLLMSPLSVSQFIEPRKVKFDLVVFDEASQVRPEDAIGSIMRGKQVIVVGDSLQLPPTSFFRMDSEEEEETIEDLESILDECSAIGIKQHMLRWHYRSRDESLIAFSNHHVYSDRLFTFPSSGRRGGEWGVSFVHVPDAIYDRGGAKTNPVEAKKVAELVMDHFNRTPDRSLGVIAFSEAQQMAILDEVDKLRMRKPEMEKYFAEDSSEEFFVKNLENVQGDERDVMIFSVGYGYDTKGKMTQNFGPLNGPGGERRLNVAVTRARLHIKVVSSIKSSDIENPSSRGASLLKEYLAYAAGEGSGKVEKAVVDADDWYSLEEGVFKALISEGFKVQKRVGRSGYRVDLAIEDPDEPGHFVLGVECDGASYRSGITARDRDRLRAEVLAGLGWKTRRVWSRDWVNDPRKEIDKIRAAYNAAKGLPDKSMRL
jgi:very-short-patch-repair endonuclease